jgi:crossover junction endodeoxyribonuclease RusA
MKSEIILPWPDKRLSPNARVHWSTLAGAKKKAKEVAYYCALGSGVRKIPPASLKVRYTFCPPDNRRRDVDNLIASMKAANDGIALAIGVDDSKWQIEIAPLGDVHPTGQVKIEIEVAQ